MGGEIDPKYRRFARSVMLKHHNPNIQYFTFINSNPCLNSLVLGLFPYPFHSFSVRFKRNPQQTSSHLCMYFSFKSTITVFSSINSFSLKFGRDGRDFCGGSYTSRLNSYSYCMYLWLLMRDEDGEREVIQV